MQLNHNGAFCANYYSVAV